MPQVDVRLATTDDLHAVMPLIKAHAHYEKAEASVSLESLSNAITGPGRSLWMWLARLEDGPVGYASATIDFSTWSGRHFVHLDCLYVEGGKRGHGIGASLLQTVRQFARLRGIEELQWQTPEWNTRAAAFYLREGARQTAKLRFTLSP